jgi:hypothetical protein
VQDSRDPAITHNGVTAMTDCKTCGQPITGRQPNAQYCSRPCKTRAIYLRRKQASIPERSELLPILAPSHRPRIRQGYEPALREEEGHKAAVRSWMENNPTVFDTDRDLPYGVYFMESGEEILFNHNYLPLWRRPGEGHPATRCDPKEFIDWFSIYWLHDNNPSPANDELLRKLLTFILHEFIAGRGLWVRQWQWPPRGGYAGMLVARNWANS